MAVALPQIYLYYQVGSGRQDFAPPAACLLVAHRLSARHRRRLLGRQREIWRTRLPAMGLGPRGRRRAWPHLFLLGCAVGLEHPIGAAGADRSRSGSLNRLAPQDTKPLRSPWLLGLWGYRAGAAARAGSAFALSWLTRRRLLQFVAVRRCGAAASAGSAADAGAPAPPVARRCWLSEPRWRDPRSCCCASASRFLILPLLQRALLPRILAFLRARARSGVLQRQGILGPSRACTSRSRRGSRRRCCRGRGAGRRPVLHPLRALKNHWASRSLRSPVFRG